MRRIFVFLGIMSPIIEPMFTLAPLISTSLGASSTSTSISTIFQLAAHQLGAQFVGLLGDALLFLGGQLRLLGLVAQQYVNGVDRLAVRVQNRGR